MNFSNDSISSKGTERLNCRVTTGGINTDNDEEMEVEEEEEEEAKLLQSGTLIERRKG
jgi:hypothetical protein